MLITFIKASVSSYDFIILQIMHLIINNLIYFYLSTQVLVVFNKVILSESIHTSLICRN